MNSDAGIDPRLVNLPAGVCLPGNMSAIAISSDWHHGTIELPDGHVMFFDSNEQSLLRRMKQWMVENGMDPEEGEYSRQTLPRGSVSPVVTGGKTPDPEDRQMGFPFTETDNAGSNGGTDDSSR